MDSGNILDNIDIKVGYLNMSLSYADIISDINKAYKACRILGSPHSTQLANEISDILKDKLVEYTPGLENDPGNPEELKNTIINVSLMVSKTMKGLIDVLGYNCEITKFLWSVNQHFQKYEAVECKFDSADESNESKQSALTAENTELLMEPNTFSKSVVEEVHKLLDEISGNTEEWFQPTSLTKEALAEIEEQSAKSPPEMSMIELLIGRPLPDLRKKVHGK